MARFVAAEIDEAIGRRIQQRRKEFGLSAEKLAEKIGVSQQQFSRYERGATKINIAHLVDIAVILDTPISWFFADGMAADLGFKQKTYVSLKDDELKLRLDYLWHHRLNSEQKRHLINFLDVMIK